MIQVPARGNTSGLVFLWGDSILELDDIATTDQEIHAIVKVCTTNKYGLSSIIYASTYRNVQKLLRENLKKLKTLIKMIG